MIKCSNCGMLNIDGTLLCEGCAWDVSMEPRIEDTDPAAAAAAAAAPGSQPSGSFDVLQPSGSFDDLPSLELASEAIPVSGVQLDAPMAAPVSQVKGPTAVQPPMAAPVSQVKGPTAVQLPPDAAPVSQLRPPTAIPPAPNPSQMRPPTAIPPASTPSQMRPPTAIPPASSPSQMRPPTAIPPAPNPSQMRPPTGVQPTSQMRPPTAIPPAQSPSQLRPPTAIPPVQSPSQLRPATGMRPSQVKQPTGMQPPAAQAPRVSMLAPELRPRLVVVRGLRTDVEYPIYDGPNFIGRFGDSPVDIDLVDQEAADNPRASRQHACLTYENGAMFIQDLGSANGTFLNRIRVTPEEKKPLKNGDYIQTGTVLFLVKEGGII